MRIFAVAEPIVGYAERKRIFALFRKRETGHFTYDAQE
jgi:hypothetical protein